MNTVCRLIRAALLLSLGVSLGSEAVLAQGTTQTPQKKTTPKAKPAAAAVETKPVLEPKAIELLKASCARLAAAHSMSFTAEITYESLVHRILWCERSLLPRGTHSVKEMDPL